MIGPRKHDGRRRLRLACIVMLTLSRPALAANPDPIDVALAACLDAASGQTTAGMVSCTDTAIKGWDTRLNQAYQKTLAALDPQSQELLRASQRKWLAFREAERASLGGPWRNGAGTLAQVTTLNAVLGAIKERVRELVIYQGGG